MPRYKSEDYLNRNGILDDVNLVQLDRADNDGSDIDEWSLDMTRGEEYFFLSFDSPSTKPNIMNRAKPRWSLNGLIQPDIFTALLFRPW